MQDSLFSIALELLGSLVFLFEHKTMATRAFFEPHAVASGLTLKYGLSGVGNKSLNWSKNTVMGPHGTLCAKRRALPGFKTGRIGLNDHSTSTWRTFKIGSLYFIELVAVWCQFKSNLVMKTYLFLKVYQR